MSNELNTQLYEKMEAEQQHYREWLLSQPPNEILNHTYEYTMRQDILMAMEEMDLSDSDAITPEDYFDKTQQEAHKIERVVRHGIVVLVLMLLWGGLFYYIKKN